MVAEGEGESWGGEGGGLQGGRGQSVGLKV